MFYIIDTHGQWTIAKAIDDTKFVQPNICCTINYSHSSSDGHVKFTEVETRINECILLVTESGSHFIFFI